MTCLQVHFPCSDGARDVTTLSSEVLSVFRSFWGEFPTGQVDHLSTGTGVTLGSTGWQALVKCPVLYLHRVKEYVYPKLYVCHRVGVPDLGSLDDPYDSLPSIRLTDLLLGRDSPGLWATGSRWSGGWSSGRAEKPCPGVGRGDRPRRVTGGRGRKGRGEGVGSVSVPWTTVGVDTGPPGRTVAPPSVFSS